MALLKTAAQLDADGLCAAMQGLGTDEDTLNEILASRTNREIKIIFREEFKRKLAKDISSDTSGDYQKLCFLLLRVTNLRILA